MSLIRSDLLFPEFAVPVRRRVVNVASVPQRSPFRYPGGKTWLVPHIREWLNSLPACPNELIEPFAGGGIIGLTVAFEQRAGHVILVEKDERVGSVWQAIFNAGLGEKLAEKIEQFPFSSEQVKCILMKERGTLLEQAFRTIIQNRVNRGGIMAKGAGMIKNGEHGKGIASRWYPHTLAQRIRAIHQIRDRISFVWGDGFDVIKQYSNRSDVAFFVDPPYTAGRGKRAGARLYAYSEINHQELFALTSNVNGHFVMTYDDTPDIRRMAERFGFETRTIAMKNTHHAEMTELLISRDVSWLQEGDE